MGFPTLLTITMVITIHGVLRSSAQAESVTWPGGTYGLPKPNAGCPTGWSEGYRYHDTEDTAPANQWSNPLDLSGDQSASYMKHWFCMKTQTRSGERAWPAGSYCIYKKGLCPSGFQHGFIHWDDEDSNNQNTAGGVLPDGSYGGDTRIDFCCRNDASSSEPISLPNVDDFMLLSRYDSCQRVYGTIMRKEWFRWDTEDVNNIDSDSGVHPYQGVESNGRNIKLNFCFYEQLPSTWPDGTYGLPKPVSGCPQDWEEGYRYQDTEDTSPNNQWSDPFHLKGIQEKSFMKHEFCMKTTADHPGSSHPNWPAGNYCIYRKGGSCPSGFSRDQNTYIHWDDEDSSNSNSHDGTLPDGTYGINTRIQFCCRSDRVTSQEMVLPAADDFFLFSITGTCQEVSGMRVTTEWFYWDTEDSANVDSQSLLHPNEGIRSDGRNILLTFCYYERR